MSPFVKDRLYNWKFGNAATALTISETLDEQELILALSGVFGNVGWFEGDMARIIDAAVCSLIGEKEE